MTANRKGRRPGNPGTADEILRSARDSFASLGYERASVRGIARAAGVDPALVLHYFGSKQHLFVAAVELPYDVGAEIGSRLATAPEAAGEGTALPSWNLLVEMAPGATAGTGVSSSGGFTMATNLAFTR